MFHNLAETFLRLYSRIAWTERGTYRLVRMVRQLRPKSERKSVFTTKLGQKMHLDLDTYPDCCMAFDLYEIRVRQQLEHHLRRGDHYVDLGANIGFFSLIAAKLIGESGRIDAFEPEPHNRKRLENHLDKNGLKDRVRVHPVAVSNSRDKVTIHWYGGDSGPLNHGSSSFFKDNASSSVATVVDTVTLDDVLKGTNPTLIKMDIEGAEHLAVSGMANILRDVSPVIIGEFNPSQAANAGVDADLWVQRCVEFQPAYRVYDIENRMCEVNPVDVGQLGQTNLLLKRST